VVPDDRGLERAAVRLDGRGFNTFMNSYSTLPFLPRDAPHDRGGATEGRAFVATRLDVPDAPGGAVPPPLLARRNTTSRRRPVPPARHIPLPTGTIDARHSVHTFRRWATSIPPRRILPLHGGRAREDLSWSGVAGSTGDRRAWTWRVDSCAPGRTPPGQRDSSISRALARSDAGRPRLSYVHGATGGRALVGGCGTPGTRSHGEPHRPPAPLGQLRRRSTGIGSAPGLEIDERAGPAESVRGAHRVHASHDVGP